MLAVRTEPGDGPLPPLTRIGTGDTAGFGPIPLGPALMVYLDPLNRRAFLTEREEAMDRREAGATGSRLPPAGDAPTGGDGPD